ncbi:MAG: eCIS core domain-containing protein [Gemmatirosa sp.]
MRHDRTMQRGRTEPARPAPDRTGHQRVRADALVTGRGGGRPLDQATRGFMEARFGHDFGKVRVHTDAAADASARATRAHAYTVGSDIAFRADQYAPDTHDGRALLGHELAHVVQQERLGGTIGGELDVSRPSDGAEREAAAVGESVARGEAVQVQSASAPAVQREGDGEEDHGIMSSVLGAFAGLHGATELIHAASLPSVIAAGDAGAPIFPGMMSMLGLGEKSVEAGQGLYAASNAGHHAAGGGLANWLGPLGLAAGAYEVYHNLSAEHMTGTNTLGAIGGAAGMVSGGVGTMGLLGSLTGSAGLASAAASLGPVGAVAGAGAAGIGIGTLIAENTGIDEAIGDGLFDVLGPEPGLWLADNLPSWLQ